MYGFGDSIFGPSFNGMLSKSASSSEQGRIQGGSQSIQALARMIVSYSWRTNLCITWSCRTCFYGYDSYSSGNSSFV